MSIAKEASEPPEDHKEHDQLDLTWRGAEIPNMDQMSHVPEMSIEVKKE